MQSFLVICAICLQLSKLGNYDQVISEQKIEACNQCLSEVMKVSPESRDSLAVKTIFEDAKTKETTLSQKVENPRCSIEEYKFPNNFWTFSEYYEKKQSKVFKPSIEKTVQRFEGMLKNISNFEEQIDKVLDEMKASMMSMVQKKMQKLMSTFDQKKMEMVHEVESLLSQESAKMMGKYSNLMDEIHNRMTEYHSAPLNDQKVINSMFDEVNKLVSQMEAQLQDNEAMILSESLRKDLDRMSDNFDDFLERISRQMTDMKLTAERTSRNTLENGKSLATGDSLVSENGAFKASVQSDGNLVIYNEDEMPMWQTNTDQEQTPNSMLMLMMEQDGRLALYDDTKNLLWATYTEDTNGSEHRVVLENDGKLVMYDEGNRVRWHTPLVKNSKKCNFFSDMPI